MEDGSLAELPPALDAQLHRGPTTKFTRQLVELLTAYDIGARAVIRIELVDEFTGEPVSGSGDEPLRFGMLGAPVYAVLEAFFSTAMYDGDFRRSFEVGGAAQIGPAV